MKIGIYGGTFNPPHLGHLAAARAAVVELGLDKLILIPAAVPPHKVLPADTPGQEHRLAMVELMADAMQLPKAAEVSAMELERAGKSYTSDTLAQLHEQYPESELWLLMGSDMYLTLHQWHDPAAIMEMAGICAFGRAREDGKTCFACQTDCLEKTYGARVHTMSIPDLVEVSSTQLRSELGEGKGQEHLLPAVYGYILRHRLYGTHADLKYLSLDDLRACSYSMVKQKRVPHIGGVEEEAVRLAQRWGADEDLARRAGILHDCTKYLELEPQLALCRQYGVELDDLERVAVKLLHAKTGACIAKYVYGQPQEVYDAIFWHTTAKEDMTLLEKILYMADYIEPCRDFDGVERLRELSYKDLDRALLLGVETTIQEMKERKLPIHEKTLKARDWLRDHGVTVQKV